MQNLGLDSYFGLKSLVICDEMQATHHKSTSNVLLVRRTIDFVPTEVDMQRVSLKIVPQSSKPYKPSKAQKLKPQNSI